MYDHYFPSRLSRMFALFFINNNSSFPLLEAPVQPSLCLRWGLLWLDSFCWGDWKVFPLAPGTLRQTLPLNSAHKKSEPETDLQTTNNEQNEGWNLGRVILVLMQPPPAPPPYCPTQPLDSTTWHDICM